MIIAMTKTNVQNKTRQETQENDRVKRRTYQLSFTNRTVYLEALDAGSASTVSEQRSEKKR
ncbi:hypothetical protein LR48_Vigan07g043800 [Vigna angularis]|uniref:Uncharacterized protein n=1 Tax=Phaseolus angularis TaxID=3914 RepID=A0A0L9UW10_PHAAN|nr:hypothetical protein LR48_Vigan07g043800 [Vigna angularis]